MNHFLIVDRTGRYYASSSLCTREELENIGYCIRGEYPIKAYAQVWADFYNGKIEQKDIESRLNDAERKIHEINKQNNTYRAFDQ